MTKRWPIDPAYELLKAILDELRRQTKRVDEAIARREDRFAGEIHRALQDTRRR